MFVIQLLVLKKIARPGLGQKTDKDSLPYAINIPLPASYKRL